MLLSRRAAAIAHASFRQHLQLQNLFTRLAGRLAERVPARVFFPPPACAAPLASNPSFPVTDEPALDFDMVEDVDKEQSGPSARRQRTDEGPTAKSVGGGGAGAAQQSTGDGEKQQNWKREGRKKRGGGKDLRIPAMQQAVKKHNLQYGMKLFREAVAEEAPLPTSILNSLLFLACGAEQWERYARGLPPLTPEEAAAAAAAAGAQADVHAAAVREGGADDKAEQEQEQPQWAQPEGQQQQQQEQQKQKGQGRPNRVFVPVPEGPPPTREELVAAVDELWSYMRTARLQPDQGTYLALARREALKGDPKAALDWAHECHQQGKPVQLRVFHPAQVGYCLAADVGQLHHIDSLIASHKLDNTEYEYTRLLEGVVAAGTYEQLRAVLMRMQTELNELSPATVDFITAFFERNSAAEQAFAPADQGGCPVLAPLLGSAAEASSGGWRWQVVRGAEVSEQGRCEAAGGTLKVIDLEDKDWDAFANAIAELARKNMGGRAGDFDGYVQWYERNGPYDILVDAANVAFFGQNFDGGGFSWAQVQHMYEFLRTRFPGKKILVMVHRKRISGPEAFAPGVQEFLEKLRRVKSLYYTPPGANDDWYWLYACVRAKQNGLLVSNDELRDHIFSLLRPKHFLKWKERHIAHYRLAFANHAATSVAQLGKMFALQMPNPYSACVQQLAESGAWMLPVSDGRWVCVRPERVVG